LEGMAQVMVEAAVCGLPIIATAASGAGEIIQEGVNGFIIEPNDEVGLMDRMNYFIQNSSKAKTMGSALVNQIRNRFSTISYGERWHEFLSKI